MGGQFGFIVSCFVGVCIDIFGIKMLDHVKVDGDASPVSSAGPLRVLEAL